MPSGESGAPAMVHRLPERREPSEQPPVGRSEELEGEAALRAQTVNASYAAAMNAAYSVADRSAAPGSRAAEALSPAQEEQVVRQVLENINYNRMANEVLDRVERRLRTERRKIGR